jgi:hypothetical protein
MALPEFKELQPTFEVSNEELLANTLRDTVAKIKQKVILCESLGENLAADLKGKRNGKELTVIELPGAIFDLTWQAGGGFVPYRLFEGGAVMRGKRCPFRGALWGNGHLCEACVGLIGGLIKENTGYAKMHLAKSMARGHDNCLLVCYFKQKKAG